MARSWCAAMRHRAFTPKQIALLGDVRGSGGDRDRERASFQRDDPLAQGDRAARRRASRDQQRARRAWPPNWTCSPSTISWATRSATYSEPRSVYIAIRDSEQSPRVRFPILPRPRKALRSSLSARPGDHLPSDRDRGSRLSPGRWSSSRNWGASTTMRKESQSYLGVPIFLGEAVLGVASVQSYKRDAFDDTDVRLLSTLAASMGVALENARSVRRDSAAAQGDGAARRGTGDHQQRSGGAGLQAGHAGDL